MIPKNDSRSDSTFRAWLQYMYRVLATKVEHYRPTNGEAVATLRNGEIVYASGDDEVSRAQSEATAAEATWVGVVDNGGAPGAQVSVKTSGRVLVRFINGETLGAAQAGTPVYVSATLGHATMISAGLANLSSIGVLEDGSEYVTVTNPVAYVYLKSACGR